MSPKREYLEYDGRCQAVIGDHQCELPASHRDEHLDGKLAWTTDSRLSPGTEKPKDTTTPKTGLGKGLKGTRQQSLPES
jgi:hypothetical protein